MDSSYWSRFSFKQATLSDNPLNKTIYFPQTNLTLNKKFWWEAFGMFGLISLITQYKPFYGFDFWIASILLFAILLSVKQSGAHYNSSMTLSNFLIKFSPDKINLYFIWTYFKADFFPAFLAYNIAFYTRGYFYPPPTPDTTWDSYSIIISELIGTFMLTLFLQKFSNSQTTFTTSDIQTYTFVVIFVYIARRFAVTSGNSINPVATFACACAALLQCTFGPFKYFYLFFIGDLLGSISGSFFYNYIYEPALRLSRQQNEQYSIFLKSQHYQTPFKRQPSKTQSPSRFSKLASDIQVIDEHHQIRITTLQNYISRIQDQSQSSSISNNSLQLEIMDISTPQKLSFQS